MKFLLLAAIAALAFVIPSAKAQAACPTSVTIANGQTTFSAVAGSTWVVCGINNCPSTSVCTFNVYRAAVAAGATCSTQSFAKITASPVASLPYTDSTVGIGNFCYYVTAVASGIESPPSANYAFVTLTPPVVTDVVGAP